MPKIGESKPLRLARHLVPGSTIYQKLFDEKKGHRRRVTDVVVRTGLVRVRTVDHAKDDDGGEIWEFPESMVVV